MSCLSDYSFSSPTYMLLIKKLGTEGKGPILLVLLFIGRFLLGHHHTNNLKEGEKNSTKFKIHANKHLLSRLKK